MIAAPPSPFPLPPSFLALGPALGRLSDGRPHVYWTDMRMRAPVMPVVALVAAAGLFRRGSWAARP